jgi:hypothetical protein
LRAFGSSAGAVVWSLAALRFSAAAAFCSSVIFWRGLRAGAAVAEFAFSITGLSITVFLVARGISLMLAWEFNFFYQTLDITEKGISDFNFLCFL